MAESTTPAHVSLATVLQVRARRLQVLLWKRAKGPFSGAWALPGGVLADTETCSDSIRRHLAAKVDVRELSHLEQLGTWSAPGRSPERREIATAYVGLVPSDLDPEVPEDTAWQPVDALPPMAFDPRGDRARRPRTPSRRSLVHERRVRARNPRRSRSRNSASCTPRRSAAVSTTNLQRVLVRRGLRRPGSGASRARRAGVRQRSSAAARAGSRSPTSRRCCDPGVARELERAVRPSRARASIRRRTRCRPRARCRRAARGRRAVPVGVPDEADAPWF